MFIQNDHPDHNRPLQPVDTAFVGAEAADEIDRYLAHRPDHAPTPLYNLPSLADELGVGAVYCKDEGERFGMGSFKALGGSYAVIRLVLQEAERELGRSVGVADFRSPQVRAVAD
ncbi:MAG TPA: hypothetical protein VFI91_11390, partial [Longimicrobiaceae bacterium]|nr:hypothetical protein [Longimicrobiaceae bacterium]